MVVLKVSWCGIRPAACSSSGRRSPPRRRWCGPVPMGPAAPIRVPMGPAAPARDLRRGPRGGAQVLLDARYADIPVREYAVKCLESLSDAELDLYMPQLIQTLKYGPYHNIICHYMI